MVVPRPRPPEPQAAVLFFARAPARGRVKTRLVPPLTPEQALRFHTACVQTTAGLLASLPRRIRKYVYFTGSPAQAHRLAAALRLPSSVRPHSQGSGGLGARLDRAFRERFLGGERRVVILGSDSPTLPARRILRALTSLDRSQVLLGPAADGGYYLIAARAETGGLPELRGGIEWGTRKTLRQTRRRLRRAGRRVRLLPPWFDVDRASDLERLRRQVGRRRAPHLERLREFFRGGRRDSSASRSR